MSEATSLVAHPRPHGVATRRIDCQEPTPNQSVLPLAGTRSGWLTVLVILVVDITSFLAVGAVGFATMYFTSVGAQGTGSMFAAWAMASLAFFHCAGLNRVAALPPASELRWLVLILGGTALAMTAAEYSAVPATAAQLLFLPCLAAIQMVVLPVIRHSARSYFSTCRWWGMRVILVGGDSSGAAVFGRLVSHPTWGFRPVAVLEELEELNLSIAPEYYHGPPRMLGEVADRLGVSTVIVVPRESEPTSIAELVRAARGSVTSWLVVPSLRDVPAMWNDAYDLQGHAAFGWRNRLASPLHRGIKRAFELAVVLVAAPFLLPLAVAIVLAIKLTSRGPALFVQYRLGRGGVRFPVFKFRTMHMNAEQLLGEYLSSHPEHNEEWRRNFKLRNDPRVTRVGRFLRKSSLDELPQLLNVLLGHMSLVGPRPLLESELGDYGEAYASYVQTTPGITGMWQISGRSNTTFAERAWYDEYYVRNWSPWLDLYILGYTVNVVVRCDGAY